MNSIKIGIKGRENLPKNNAGILMNNQLNNIENSGYINQTISASKANTNTNNDLHYGAYECKKSPSSLLLKQNLLPKNRKYALMTELNTNECYNKLDHNYSCIDNTYDYDDGLITSDNIDKNMNKNHFISQNPSLLIDDNMNLGLNKNDFTRNKKNLKTNAYGKGNGTAGGLLILTSNTNNSNSPMNPHSFGRSPQKQHHVDLLKFQSNTKGKMGISPKEHLRKNLAIDKADEWSEKMHEKIKMIIKREENRKLMQNITYQISKAKETVAFGKIREYNTIDGINYESTIRREDGGLKKEYDKGEEIRLKEKEKLQKMKQVENIYNNKIIKPVSKKNLTRINNTSTILVEDENKRTRSTHRHESILRNRILKTPIAEIKSKRASSTIRHIRNERDSSGYFENNLKFIDDTSNQLKSSTKSPVLNRNLDRYFDDNHNLLSAEESSIFNEKFLEASEKLNALPAPSNRENNKNENNNIQNRKRYPNNIKEKMDDSQVDYANNKYLQSESKSYSSQKLSINEKKNPQPIRCVHPSNSNNNKEQTYSESHVEIQSQPEEFYDNSTIFDKSNSGGRDTMAQKSIGKSDKESNNLSTQDSATLNNYLSLSPNKRNIIIRKRANHLRKILKNPNNNHNNNINNTYIIHRDPSNKNVLDDLADDNRIQSLNFNQSFDTQLISSTPFDKLLDTSIISYLNERDIMPQDRTKRDIESFIIFIIIIIVYLSMTKHPYLKKSKITSQKSFLKDSKDNNNTNNSIQDLSKLSILNNHNNDDRIPLTQHNSESHLFKSTEIYEKTIDFNFDDENTIKTSNIIELQKNSTPVITKEQKKNQPCDLGQINESSELHSNPKYSLQSPNIDLASSEDISPNIETKMSLNIHKSQQNFTDSHFPSKCNSKQGLLQRLDSIVNENIINPIKADESPKSSKPSIIKPLYFYCNNTLNKTKHTNEKESYKLHDKGDEFVNDNEYPLTHQNSVDYNPDKQTIDPDNNDNSFPCIKPDYINQNEIRYIKHQKSYDMVIVSHKDIIHDPRFYEKTSTNTNTNPNINNNNNSNNENDKADSCKKDNISTNILIVSNG